MRFLLTAAAAIAVLLCAPLLQAQVGTSTLTGRVTDPTGAVVPNAAVTVTNRDTNFQFLAKTNEEGMFRVQSLQPGPYRVVFEAAGFKRTVRDGITLRIGDVLPVNAVLEVGNLAESIEVTSQAQLLETETSSTGAIVEGTYLYKLPMYQRYTNSTLHLVPGLSSGGFTWGATLGGYHLAGQRDGGIGIFEDGVNGNDQEGGTGTIRPIQNSIAEVKVLTTTLPAEYGHSSGGVIAVVKKTGTNEFHGLASNYGRSRVMSHRNFFDRYKFSEPQPNNPNGQQVFYMLPDANAGGPVVLPKIYNGRNRTFFFFGYQKMIEKKNGQYLGTVPTDEMKQGDFSFGGLGNPIYDPLTTRRLDNGDWTRDPFPDKRLPLSRFDPVSKKVLALDPWKAPNQPAAFTSNGPVNNLLYDQPRRAFWEDYNGRLDHQFTPNLKIYGSYTYNHQSGKYPALTLKVCDLDRNCDETPFTQQNYSAGKTWVISPTIVNDARAGYYRRRDDRYVGSYGKNYGQTLGIPNISPELFPAFTTGYELSAVAGPSLKIGETLSFRDDLSVVRGVHALKLGYEVLRFRVNRWTVNTPSGNFTFTGLTGLQGSGNAMPRTGNTFAGFLEGSVSSASFDLQLANWLPRSSIHSFYLQDDWKVSPAVTLNLGIRYTTESPFSTKYNQMSNFDPAAADDIAVGALGNIVHPKGALNARDTNNFQPRIGVAWHPAGKWVFRGGFAVNTVDVKFPGDQFQEYSASVVQNRASGDPRPLYAWSRGPDPFTYRVRQDGTGMIQTTNYGSRSASWWDSKLRNPYVLNWNLSVQHELAPNYLLELMYQASAGIGLVENWNLNSFPIDFAANDPALRAKVYAAPQNYRPWANFGDIRFRSNWGHSTFHSGTIKLEKRMSAGLMFSTFYTWAKAIDSQDTDGSGSGVAPLQNRGLEKARAGYDRKHRYVGTVSYELPFGRGKRFLNRGGAWNKIFGGFEIAWVQTFESGNPLTFGFSNSPYNYYPTFAGSRRADLIGSPHVRDGWRDLGGDRFNSVNMNPVLESVYDFAYPQPFTVGTSGRNIIDGLPLVWSQASAKKNIRITERFNAQLRLDMTNALKTWNFNPPSTTVDLVNPQTFGKVSSSPLTSSFGGQPVMNLKVELTW
jgi:hypothetical protein